MKIYLKYYSGQNLGDDLFVKIFCEHFSESRIYLIGNPRYFPEKIKNARKDFSTLCFFVLGFLKTRTNFRLILTLEKWLIKRISRRHIFVTIGGSIFMDNRKTNREIDFSIQEKNVSYINEDSINFEGTQFVLNANLGPIYSNEYISNIRKNFSDYKHVVLRDFSSYLLVKDMKNVSYAPDCAFMLKKRHPINKKKIMVISVIDYNRFEKQGWDYLNLLEKISNYYIKKGFKVILTSFCDREGDNKTIEQLKKRTDGVESLIYNGRNIDEICKCFSEATFVIASRFHSMILAMLYKKPFVPIIYNCKMKNYLIDVNFSGLSILPETVAQTSEVDIEKSLQEGLNYNCEDHFTNAKKQFSAVEKYINSFK